MLGIAKAPLILFLLSASVGAWPTVASADSSADSLSYEERRGWAIALEAERRHRGFGDFSAELRMVLRDAYGTESTHRLRSRFLEQIDGSEKSLVIFDFPQEVKGTAFLTVNRSDGDGDHWHYSPDLKKAKRVSWLDRRGSFMGSELTYDELSTPDAGAFTYRFKRRDEIAGLEAFVIERTPKRRRPGYSRQEVWIDRQEYRTWKVVYLDRKGNAVKTLVFSGYRQYDDRYWRPGLMRMLNHRTGRSTDLIWTTYAFGNGFPATDFEEAGLAQIR